MSGFLCTFYSTLLKRVTLIFWPFNEGKVFGATSSRLYWVSESRKILWTLIQEHSSATFNLFLDTLTSDLIESDLLEWCILQKLKKTTISLQDIVAAIYQLRNLVSSS